MPTSEGVQMAWGAAVQEYLAHKKHTPLTGGSVGAGAAAGTGGGWLRMGGIRPPRVNRQSVPRQEREFFIDNLLVRVNRYFWCTGLAPWEFESPFPGSLISTFLGPPILH